MDPTALSPLALMTFAYLAIGLLTTILAWVHLSDEIEMSITIDLEDEADRPLQRSLLTVALVLSWPLVLGEVLRKR